MHDTFTYAEIFINNYVNGCLFQHNLMKNWFMFLTQIVSCSGDGIIAYNDVERTDVHGRFLFNCHYGTAYEVSMIY